MVFLTLPHAIVRKPRKYPPVSHLYTIHTMRTNWILTERHTENRFGYSSCGLCSVVCTVCLKKWRKIMREKWRGLINAYKWLFVYNVAMCRRKLFSRIIVVLLNHFEFDCYPLFEELFSPCGECVTRGRMRECRKPNMQLSTLFFSTHTTIIISGNDLIRQFFQLFDNFELLTYLDFQLNLILLSIQIPWWADIVYSLFEIFSLKKMNKVFDNIEFYCFFAICLLRSNIEYSTDQSMWFACVWQKRCKNNCDAKVRQMQIFDVVFFFFFVVTCIILIVNKIPCIYWCL